MIWTPYFWHLRHVACLGLRTAFFQLPKLSCQVNVSTQVAAPHERMHSFLFSSAAKTTALKNFTRACCSLHFERYPI